MRRVVDPATGEVSLVVREEHVRDGVTERTSSGKCKECQREANAKVSSKAARARYDSTEASRQARSAYAKLPEVRERKNAARATEDARRKQRELAASRGLYFGPPCVRGGSHVNEGGQTERYGSGSCVQCQRERSILRWQDPEVRGREMARRQAEKERIAARQRVYRATRWAQDAIARAASSSRKRGHEPPTITEDWVLSRFASNGGVCPYTGRKLDPQAEPRSPNKPSLDRIDNAKGYTPDNVEVTSWAWNERRGALQAADIDEMLTALVVFRERVASLRFLGEEAHATH